MNIRLDAVAGTPIVASLACSRGPGTSGGLINATPYPLGLRGERRGGNISNPAFAFQISSREKGMEYNIAGARAEGGGQSKRFSATVTAATDTATLRVLTPSSARATGVRVGFRAGANMSGIGVGI